MGVLTSGSGYNGWTGAKASYDDAEGMWIDSNGERIRSDAIVAGDPPAAAAPAAPAPVSAAPPAPSYAAPSAPAAEEPAGGGSLGALAAASSGAGYQEGTPGALNPKLGTRLLASSLGSLAQAAGRIY